MKRPSLVESRAVASDRSRLPPDIHPVIRRVLLGRGVTDPAELALDLGNMQNPGRLSNIGQAAELVAQAVMDGQSLLIVGDFDADGATGTALAVLSLRAMGCGNVSFRVPNRFEFGYGLTEGLVDTLSADPPDLLITVDSGIACVAGVARARELGSRVIVTDHHLPGTELPRANAIVNPNQSGDEFPSKALAGVGVVFYLLAVVRQVLREAGWFGRARPEPNLAKYLDLVALGTVADLVPLDHNNRVLVRQGLERIRRCGARPGLMALLRVGKRDYRYVTAADLGFAVAPRLNAAGRLEDMGAGIRCLLTDDAGEATRLASELDELNRRRRGLQEQMQRDAIEQADRILDQLGSEQQSRALCLYDESWHQGIVGLVASRIKDRVNRPVIAFAPESEGGSLLKGSARSVKGLHIRDTLALVDARQPGFMEAFGGHAMAAGLTLKRKRLERFGDLLSEAVNDIMGGAEFEQTIVTDGVLEPADLGLPLALEIERYGPWGQRFPEPIFHGVFDVIDRRVVGGAHLKMIVQNKDGGEELDAIAFNCLPEDLPSSGGVRLLYRLGINRWRGQENCQLLVEQIL
jgi:single-stranded-DNA-specific exonuclease